MEEQRVGAGLGAPQKQLVGAATVVEEQRLRFQQTAGEAAPTSAINTSKERGVVAVKEGGGGPVQGWLRKDSRQADTEEPPLTGNITRDRRRLSRQKPSRALRWFPSLFGPCGTGEPHQPPTMSVSVLGLLARGVEQRTSRTS